MSEETLILEKRKLTGKKVKGLRADGKIPSVVYGKDIKEPILTESAYNETEKLLNKTGYHSTIDLEIAGKKQMAMVKVVDLDPVKRTILSVEFQAVSANRPVEAVTPIVIVNFEESVAAKAKLETTQVLEDIAIKAKPADLVAGLEIDASGLKELEDKLTLADLKLPKGIEFVDPEIDLETAIVVMYDPIAEAEAREAAAAAKAAAKAEKSGDGEEKATENKNTESAEGEEAEKSE